MSRLSIEVRQSRSSWLAGATLGTGVVVGMLLSAMLLIAAGVAAGDLFSETIGTAFFDIVGLAQVFTVATIVVVTGLAAAVALKVDFWNIGIEGQMAMGAIGATGCALFAPLNGAAMLAGMACAAVAAGMLWALIAGVLKLRLGVNEVITTLLLNYIAAFLIQYLVYGAWRDPASGFPQTAEFGVAARLPLIGWQQVNAGGIVSLAIVALCAYGVGRTRFGAYMAAIGANARAAAGSGVPVSRVLISVVLCSGGLGGLAGFLLMAGQQYRLSPGVGTGFGFTGLMIAFLARYQPVAVLVTGVLVAGLYVAGDSLQTFHQLSSAIVGLIEAIILMSAVSADFFVRYRLVWHRADRTQADAMSR
jgi:ABC-type uncharacterized transport system permease subunit